MPSLFISCTLQKSNRFLNERIALDKEKPIKGVQFIPAQRGQLTLVGVSSSLANCLVFKRDGFCIFGFLTFSSVV